MEMEVILGVLKPMIEALGGKFGIVLQVVAYVGMLRILIKPIQGLVLAIVELIPGNKDNEAVNKFFESKIFKMIVFVLDWLGSIKIKK